MGCGRKGRMQAVRQAYAALGVTRDISDPDLERVYAELVEKESPASKPAELAGYYENRSKALHEAYACIRSHRFGSAPSSYLSSSTTARPQAGASCGVSSPPPTHPPSLRRSSSMAESSSDLSI